MFGIDSVVGFIQFKLTKISYIGTLFIVPFRQVFIVNGSVVSEIFFPLGPMIGPVVAISVV